MRWIPRRRPKPAACREHHWHYTGRGWECCHGRHGITARIAVRQDQPDDTISECADRPGHFDDLQGWLHLLSTDQDAVHTRPRRVTA